MDAKSKELPDIPFSLLGVPGLVSVQGEHETVEGSFYELQKFPMPRDIFMAAFQMLRENGGFFVKGTNNWYVPADNWSTLHAELSSLSEQLDSRRIEERERIINLANEVCPSSERADKPYEGMYSARREIAEDQSGGCAICSNEINAIHHIIPLDFGGSSGRENLIGLCNACHGAIHGAYRREAQRRALENDPEYFHSIIDDVLESADAE